METVEPNGLWAYLQSRPGEYEILGQAMTAKAVADIAAVPGAYKFATFGTIADVGRGRGHLLRAVLVPSRPPRACCSILLKSSRPSTSARAADAAGGRLLRRRLAIR